MGMSRPSTTLSLRSRDVPLRNLDFRQNLPDIICRLRIVRIGRFFWILPIFGKKRPTWPWCAAKRRRFYADAGPKPPLPSCSIRSGCRSRPHVQRGTNNHHGQRGRAKDTAIVTGPNHQGAKNADKQERREEEGLVTAFLRRTFADPCNYHAGDPRNLDQDRYANDDCIAV